ncbi:MAG TPA: sigma-54 dependent transcriptional regulator [Methylomirabilota bacterium]|jgi:two-component system nitrogen regulation response regulator GlnG|nr:sigma-54 dependent transcriptional regulator [Methylomirabilota bacterium]
MDKILVVDDERNIHYSFRRVLGNEYEVLSAFSGEEALRQAEDEALRLILMDVRMPGGDGLDTLQELKRRRPDLPVIIMTAFVSAETAIRATTLDAEDYLVKPFDVDALKRLIETTLQRREPTAPEPDAPLQRFDAGETPILGRSRAMQEVYKIIGKSAARDVTVLITGESGTGKELVAHALHAYSQRNTGPFVAINCAAIPETLLESELFGHERGAFSGAAEARPGKFELAHGGTLFLDEIGDMPVLLQAKLLRVLQEREIHRLGAREPRRVDVRIIAATNQDPEGLIRTGRFREDLYFRLNVVRISLPPLRERGEDILLLADYFLARARREDARGPQELTASAQEKLLAHSWPGNVRELANVIEQAAIHTRGQQISAEDIILSEVPLREPETPPPAPQPSHGTMIEDLFVQQPGKVFAAVERLLVAKALELSRHNQVQAARLLGVSRNVLRDRMKRYGLS